MLININILKMFVARRIGIWIVTMRFLWPANQKRGIFFQNLLFLQARYNTLLWVCLPLCT